MMSALRLIGYDGTISIEHEDAMMSTEEGLEKAVDVLKEVVMKDPVQTDVFWA